ncbi:unnamed protein product [Ceutorhynchus assimilis]|uniref:Frizzled 2 n=1 Tax=Ceutorhynchus assimilis TaxID=467358 RepID=A0A9N9MYY4_9CUCU|nr:unnamed protein product [Ceutorhynchus assimilis]
MAHLLAVSVMLLVSSTTCSVISSSPDQDGKCEQITIPMCLDIKYNMTKMPNEFNHESQEQAGLEVHQFWPLVEIKCSPDLKFFLCSTYAPICLSEYSEPLPPCRDMCRRAREGCEPIMTRYGLQWPERMKCDRFPEQGGELLCMDHPTDNTSSTPRPMETQCRCHCQKPLISLLETEISPLPFNRNVLGVPNCAFPCKETFFSPEEKEFALIWISLWSGLCAASTLMTLITFFIETERFKYPDRPIVFVSACQFLVSVGYLIRVAVGHERVACEGAIIRYTSSGPSLCTLVFLLVYFFGMASSSWWVILSLTWFLATGLKWGKEAIASYDRCFHVAAWIIPTLQTLGVLLSGAVDGDPVSGICYVGNMNTVNLQTFVLGPLIIYLILGISFLMAVFVSLFRIRNVIEKRGGPGADSSKTDKLKKLTIRIGIFSVLYTVSATIVIGCHLYENAFHNEWLKSLACGCFYPIKAKPLYSVLMLKYLMALAVGITSGIWIWSGKTLDSWRRLWKRLFCRPDLSEAEIVENKAPINGLENCESSASREVLFDENSKPDLIEDFDIMMTNDEPVCDRIRLQTFDSGIASPSRIGASPEPPGINPSTLAVDEADDESEISGTGV